MMTPNCTAECVHPHPRATVAAIDHVVLRHRREQTTESHQALLEAMQADVRAFHAEQASEFIARTSR